MTVTPRGGCLAASSPVPLPPPCRTHAPPLRAAPWCASRRARRGRLRCGSGRRSWPTGRPSPRPGELPQCTLACWCLSALRRSDVTQPPPSCLLRAAWQAVRVKLGWRRQCAQGGHGFPDGCGAALAVLAVLEQQRLTELLVVEQAAVQLCALGGRISCSTGAQTCSSESPTAHAAKVKKAKSKNTRTHAHRCTHAHAPHGRRRAVGFRACLQTLKPSRSPRQDPWRPHSPHRQISCLDR